VAKQSLAATANKLAMWWTSKPEEKWRESSTAFFTWE
jgi:hypothetical protein